MNAVIIIAIIAGYLVIGGASGSLLLSRERAKCPEWQYQQQELAKGRRGSSYDRCEAGFDHGWTIIAGIAWPVAIPLLIGVLLGNYATTGEARAERREKRKQADHERKMAELQAQQNMTMESVRFLVENGIKADVPGLFDIDGRNKP